MRLIGTGRRSTVASVSPSIPCLQNVQELSAEVEHA